MNGVVSSAVLVIIFQALPQRMGGYADDCVQLGIKGFRAPKGVDRDAVLLDLVDGTFKVLFANKRQKPDEVVGPPEHTGRQNVVYFSALRLKLADCRLQNDYPFENGPVDTPPSPLHGSITEFSEHGIERKT